MCKSRLSRHGEQAPPYLPVLVQAVPFPWLPGNFSIVISFQGSLAHSLAWYPLAALSPYTEGLFMCLLPPRLCGGSLNTKPVLFIAYSQGPSTSSTHILPSQMEKRWGPHTTSLRARKTHGDTPFPSLFWAKRASLM